MYKTIRKWYNAVTSGLGLQGYGSGTGFETNGDGIGICGFGREPNGLVNVRGIVSVIKE